MLLADAWNVDRPVQTLDHAITDLQATEDEGTRSDKVETAREALKRLEARTSPTTIARMRSGRR